MDYAADQKAGKRTLAWLVHGENNKYLAVIAINFLPYLLVILSVILKLLPPWFLLALLALPWSISLVRSMFAFKKDPFAAVQKKWWYGRFSNWDQICTYKLDWFMLRWLLAQKIDTIFSLLCIIAVIIVLIVR